MATIKRTSLTITYSVWRALFLREMVDRLFGKRAAWMWLLLDPILHIVFIMILFSVIRQKIVGGMETPIWIMTGLLAYFVFDRSAKKGMTAVASNQPLFTFRQVKPVDTVMVRAVLEAFLVVPVAVILLTGASLLGQSVVPTDPLLVLEAGLGLWLVGLGLGLVISIPNTLIPEAGNLVGYFFLPLYMTSGVIFPVSSIPAPYSDWMSLNPLLHGVEGVRRGFAPYYQAIPALDIAYLYGFGIVLVFFGLVLHRHFALRLATK